MLGRRKQFRNGEQKTYLIVCSSLVVYTLKYKRYKNEIDKLKSTTIYHIREGSAQCKIFTVLRNSTYSIYQIQIGFCWLGYYQLLSRRRK